MKSSAKNIQMTSFDDLFSAGGAGQENCEKVQEVVLTELFPFKDHPFKVLDDETMQDTVESIREHGVIHDFQIDKINKWNYNMFKT